jgi:hypothetical protein
MMQLAIAYSDLYSISLVNWRLRLSDTKLRSF